MEENIAIGTRSENMLDIPETIRKQRMIKANAARRKLTSKQISELLKNRKNGFTFKALALKYNISCSTAYNAVSGKIYKTLK